MVNQKVQPGATITINDSNGKYIKFAVKQEIDLNIATQVKMINVALKEKEIKGKEIKLQIGANTDSSQTLKVKIDNMSTESLEISKDDISNMKKEGSKGTEAATKMIDNLDDALERVNVSRGNLGAMQNRLQTASSNLNTMNENLTSIESRIRDVDVAKEIEFIKNKFNNSSKSSNNGASKISTRSCNTVIKIIKVIINKNNWLCFNKLLKFG